MMMSMIYIYIYGTIIFDENDVSLKIHNIKTNKVMNMIEPDINR